MSRKTRLELIPFDAARYLTDRETIAEFLAAILEENDTELMLRALNDVARASGMARVARATGLGREGLSKALAPGSKLRFETVLKVARAVGVRFTAETV